MGLLRKDFALSQQRGFSVSSQKAAEPCTLGVAAVVVGGGLGLNQHIFLVGLARALKASQEARALSPRGLPSSKPGSSQDPQPPTRQGLWGKLGLWETRAGPTPSGWGPGHAPSKEVTFHQGPTILTLAARIRFSCWTQTRDSQQLYPLVCVDFLA